MLLFLLESRCQVEAERRVNGEVEGKSVGFVELPKGGRVGEADTDLGRVGVGQGQPPGVFRRTFFIVALPRGLRR